jgi:hypothetical protein
VVCPHFSRRIERILGPGEPDPARRTLVEDFFCQTFEVVPQIHAYRRAQESRKTWSVLRRPTKVLLLDTARAKTLGFLDSC